ncbi:TetR family transcriptional regulator [Pectobacterium versatile]|uniref:TetR/AcrR family transcriptional regulator n=2 Tax=Pectobacteriaceae TaxID=1903410 RepID=A0ABU8K0P7_9GAMM|nr:TetR/AcrR family transcriptional regulator [Pectobacterium versatile]AZK64836.1 TetR/AcrR family transcriptional regulator [Pectobacterium versatile]MBA0171623.1 TetR/AcrR family transcriptional regulator [Pectobacterium versatile]MBQ4769532.1 TetR family transcriptional regulator [Pectobacterium versatile]MBQ4773850.1 TetR family transcriptional regulator [Pectobacterium versatile]POY52793.1 TetR family transcriptional regulator [Pectobacterium versatile]
MGRHKSINRACVLDAAEQIVRTQGTAALTIDAVAKAAGVTKGGIQSCFGTKDELIHAMYQRWEDEFDEMAAVCIGTDDSREARVRAHVDITYRTDAAEGDRAAGMMASLLNTPEHLARSQAWYDSQLAGLDLNSQEGRDARLAFLASEGAFLLRYFGFMAVDDETWKAIFSDISRLLPERTASS